MVKKPSHVRMPKAFQDLHRAFSMQMRRVGIAITVAIRMMTAMNSRPENNRPLRRHGTRNNQRNFQNRSGLVSAMGNQAMKAHSNAEHGHGIHNRKHYQIKRTDSTTPK